MEEKSNKELQHYREMFGADDLATKAYRALVKMLRQQIDVLNDFDLNANINLGDKKYDRALKMFNDMPDMVLALKDLKDKLGVEYVEKTERQKAITPQSIGYKNGTNV